MSDGQCFVTTQRHWNLLMRQKEIPACCHRLLRSIFALNIELLVSLFLHMQNHSGVFHH